MKILVVSQYFWPESFIINDIVRTLDEQGHEVVVATGKPNYPDGKIFDGYRAKGTQQERYLGKIDVLRIPLWPRGVSGAKNLMLNYLSFVFSGLLFMPWMLRKREFDAILVFAPSPILQAIPAIPLKWLKKAKLTLWVQDLWPESLSATGFIRNRHVLRVVGLVVKAIYRHCDTLLVQSRAFVEPVARYAALDKIQYYPNSMDVRGTRSAFVISPELDALLKQHFCVVFAGNLGTAQALDTLVEAAAQLRDEPEIRIVLVGSGSRLDWLRSQQKALGLENLVLPGRFPMEAMTAIFEQSSALLVSLTDEEAFAQTIPSKIQAYLAAGRPIIACMNGEGARVVYEAGAGLTSPAEQVLPLVDNIRRMKALGADERAVMGEAGRACFNAHFEMESQVIRLVELLQR
ncbi:glycosyltransferase involved in cell wall biosynthesis [Pseudomonas corrugata]|uniref:glycosyltransferase family 4 protein n=1 Tax=Pseudomonas corrugata TaxID=47879 RepID=UPI002854675D|nr:glycosyltransferase family 4 protein [Pseudomonas corrugata]MDR7281968.1 glycosyltransferase involved in cell wall biosynthesis [Pseudomonas corrugata]